jgi:cytochrome P450
MVPASRPASWRAPSLGRPEDVHDFLHDPVGCMCRLHRAYGPLAVFGRGEQRFVFAFGPHHNRRLFTDLNTFHIVSRFPGPRRSAQRRFGRGLFSMNGDEHRHFRRLLMPPFRNDALDGYHAPLADLVAGLLRDWQPGQTLDLMQQMKELTLRVTAHVLFGVEDLALAHAIAELFEEWLDLNHVVSFSAQLPVEAPPGCYPALLDVAERLEHQLQALAACKRRLGAAGDDVLALMLRARAAGQMDEEELIGQTITVFNAAFHTTTSALTWALFLLAQHPAVMQPLDRELHDAVAGQVPTPDELGRLALLDRVVKESLRLMPSVVYLPRITSRPTVLGPYELPAGTMVLASPYVSHHLAEVFPQPQRFDPDRWLAGPPVPWGYIPFGGGSRMCLGAPFATLLVKLTLAVVLSRFRLEVVPGACIERHGTLSLGARHGVPVRLHAPDRAFAASPVSGNIHEMVELPEALRVAARAA